MAKNTVINSIAGVRFSSTNAGIYKNQNRDDLVLIELAEQSHVAGVFTKNAFCAAPVVLAKKHLEQAAPKYFLINAGNANAGTGEPGLSDALSTCETLAQLAECETNKVLPFSTGVIGQKLPVEQINDKLPELLANLHSDAILAAAKAIKTTDLVEKAISRTVEIDGKIINISGIAKGSGMIKPDMATMLCYVFTDAIIDQDTLDELLRQSVDNSFHRITVDSDTSTNDSCMLAATGASDVRISRENLNEFKVMLDEVFLYLAKAIVRDAEGASKFITINIHHGLDLDECLEVAFNIAHSPLVKTACFASDPNWGRILAVIGRSDIRDLDISKVDIALGDSFVIKSGTLDPDYEEAAGITEMNKQDISINVDLHRGDHTATVYTSDLSYDYVKINAEYRT